MAAAARQRVEQRGAIAGVAARQDVRRIGGPEENALAPQFGPPRRVDPRPVSEKPAPDDCFGKLRSALSRCRRGEVAKPGESLQLLGQRPIAANGREIQIRKVDGLAPGAKPSGEQSVAAATISL